MTTRYNARHLPSIYRQDVSNETSGGASTSDWYSDFIGNLHKNSYSASSSIYDEISAILDNKKHKYSSVEEAVQDMKERTGLSKLLEARRVIAYVQEDMIEKIPEMKIFIDNFVETRPGTSIEAVVHDLLKNDDIRNKLPDRNDVSDHVRNYINKKITDMSKNKDNTVNMNIGKFEPSNDMPVDDPLALCEPNSVK